MDDIGVGMLHNGFALLEGLVDNLVRIQEQDSRRGVNHGLIYVKRAELLSFPYCSSEHSEVLCFEKSSGFSGPMAWMV